MKCLLFADTPFSSIVVEQLHGTIAVLARLHPEYECETLMARAMSMVLQKLMPSQTRLDKSIAKTETKLRKLSRADPFKQAGRHVFISKLNQKSREKNGNLSPYERNKIRK